MCHIVQWSPTDCTFSLGLHFVMESLLPANTLSMSCKKCKGPSTTVLRKSDWYCDDCVIHNTNHKFRSCIGKNKILSSNEKVMVCLSGGPGSAAMLDLVYSGISLDSHKKLRISPVALHIIDYENYERCTSLVQQCKKYDFDIHIAHISEYVKTNSKLPEKNFVPQVNKSLKNHFNTMLTSSSATGQNEVIKKIKRSLFIRYANLLECTAIFTGETTTTLATNLLTNLALGCGPHIEHDVGFCDKRNIKVILRPMKDITKEELDHYIKIKKLLSIIKNNEIKENSLQSIIGAFVIDLQENFQATVSTVCKIADKVGVQTRNHHKCVFCESDLDVKDLKLSALEATKLSRTLSSEVLRSENIEHNILNFQNGRATDQTMFPFIHKTLCYCCSKNLAEIKICNMPCELQKDLSGM